MNKVDVMSSVIEQLELFGEVQKLGPTGGLFTDPSGKVWTWTVLIRTVSFDKAGFRPRHIDYENVSQYMFDWLYDDEECRPYLQFTLGLADVVKLFGRKSAHDAIVKGRQDGSLRSKG